MENIFERFQEKVFTSKRVGQKLSSFASVMGGEILGFAVFRFCFVLFFVNGVRLKLWSFVLFCFSWREHLFGLGFFVPA